FARQRQSRWRCTEARLPQSSVSSGRSPWLAGQFGLGGGETSDRYAVGRARHVVEPDFAAELDRGGVAAMLAADAELDVGARLAAAFGGDPDHLADPGGVDRHKRVMLENPQLLVRVAEACRVVARNAVDG